MCGCKKSWLDVAPDKSLIIPTELKDFQAILDNSEQTFNYSPGLILTSSDDFYIEQSGLLALVPYERNSYLWAKEVYEGRLIDDWSKPYQQVFYTNIVLEGLQKVTQTSANKEEWNSIKGTALFHRAFAFFNLAQMFAASYDPVTADQLPGIPIRLSANVNDKSKRGTLRQTYDQIIQDLTEAMDLLPLNTTVKTRPDKTAAMALFSRLYLIMGNYEQAERFADLSLAATNKLLDYNTIDTLGTGRPFPATPSTGTGNPEVLFYSGMPLYVFPTRTELARVDTLLYRSYDHRDLRKVLFFRNRGNGNYTFRGTYSGGLRSHLFSGLATDEMYLNRAECLARRNQVSKAMNDLNTLLVKRWKKDKFIPLSANNADEALTLIFNERRKELISRGIRWTDLRRLNKETKYAITLKRVIGGTIYLLPPGDQRYVFPLPNDELTGFDMLQIPVKYRGSL